MLNQRGCIGSDRADADQLVDRERLFVFGRGYERVIGDRGDQRVEQQRTLRRAGASVVNGAGETGHGFADPPEHSRGWSLGEWSWNEIDMQRPIFG